MDSKRYIQCCLETESSFFHCEEPRMLHSVMGISTEAGELLDAFKKNIFYGKPIDKVNIVEELGDLLWYVAIMCDCLQISFEDIMQINIDKLRIRYPNKFTSYHAQNRNLESERKVLERKGEANE